MPTIPKKTTMTKKAEKPWIIEPIKDVVCPKDPQFQEAKYVEMGDFRLEIPDIANRGRYVKATVHAVGPDVKTVRVGEVWYIPEARGERWKDGDVTYLFYPENELLGREVR